MKKILLLLLLSLMFGQTDNIGSEAFNLTADHLFHSGRDKLFSDGTILFKSDTNRVDVDSSAFWISDSTAGTRASGMFLLQEGDTIYSSAADLNLLHAFTDSGYTIIIDSSGYLLDVPRTVYGWGHDLTFSATDYNTIAWTSGDLYFANKDTFNIVAGNTGNISDIIYIYFDSTVSATVLQTTTIVGNAVGLGSIIVCVGEDVVTVTKSAVFQVFGNSGQSLRIGTTQIDDNSITTGLILANTILAADIAANTITGNEISANSITTNEIYFGSLTDSILYVINASAEGLFITGDRVQITGATTFASGYDVNITIFQIAPPTVRADGSSLETGDYWIADSTGGNIPKIWNGSSWETAFTFINGGYLKTGVIDADVVGVTNLNADSINAGTIDANRIDVSELSAISANLGTITAGVITGTKILATSSNDSVRINDTGINFYNSGGNLQKMRFFYGGTEDGSITANVSNQLAVVADNGSDLYLWGDDDVYLYASDDIILNKFPSYTTNVDAYFSVYKSATQLFTAVADTLFDTNTTQDYDHPEDNFNTGTGVFTAPATGYYHFDLHSNISTTQANVQYYRIYVIANGKTYGSYMRNDLTEGTFNGIDISFDTYMTASSTAIAYIIMETGTSGGKTEAGREDTWFSGHRIR